MMNLSKYKKEIIANDVLNIEPVLYEENRYIKHFKSKHYLRKITHYDNTFLSRKVIINVYKDYYNGIISDPILPFFLTLVWGYNTPGYGPFRVNNLINVRNKKLVRDGLRHVRNGDIKSAFDTLMKIKGLKVSFVSKVLYFAARSIKIKNYPLIFDIQVARGLVSLASKGTLDGMLFIAPEQDFNSYQLYNKFMHDQSWTLGVKTESLEFFIFKYLRDK